MNRPHTRRRQFRTESGASSAAAESTDGIPASGAWSAAVLAGALTTALLSAAPLPEAAYLDGPPPAHAGGFGDDTCHACHFENELDDPGGSLTVSGVPDTFDPSAAYRITISLERPGMGRAGFQLAARDIRYLMRFDMRAELNAKIITAFLHGCDIALHSIKVNQDAGRFEVMYGLHCHHSFILQYMNALMD